MRSAITPFPLAAIRVAAKTLRKWRLRRGPLILELPLSFKLTPTKYTVDIPKDR
jgi:hypothetical protein